MVIIPSKVYDKAFLMTMTPVSSLNRIMNRRPCRQPKVGGCGTGGKSQGVYICTIITRQITLTSKRKRYVIRKPNRSNSSLINGHLFIKNYFQKKNVDAYAAVSINTASSS